MKSIARFKKNLLKIMILKCLESFFYVSRGYPLTQFEALKNSLAQRSIGNNFKKTSIQKIEICSIKMLKTI